MLMHAKYNNNSHELHHSSGEGSKLGVKPRKLSNGQEIGQENQMIVPQDLEDHGANMDLG